MTANTTPVWNKLIPSSLSEKIKLYEIICTGQIGEELARYVAVLPTDDNFTN